MYTDDHRGRYVSRLEEPAPLRDPLTVTGEDDCLGRIWRDVHRYLPTTVVVERLGNKLSPSGPRRARWRGWFRLAFARRWLVMHATTVVVARCQSGELPVRARGAHATPGNGADLMRLAVPDQAASSGLVRARGRWCSGICRRGGRLQVRIVNDVALRPAARRYQIIGRGLDLVLVDHHQQGCPTTLQLGRRVAGVRPARARARCATVNRQPHRRPRRQPRLE